MTWTALVRKHLPRISKVEADRVLWNATCYPFGTVEQVEAQLVALRSFWRSGKRRGTENVYERVWEETKAALAERRDGAAEEQA